MCSAQNLGEIVTGSPVASARSISRWSIPLACRSISTRRLPREAPSNTIFQNS